jgi:hypothetical protein
VTGTRRRGILRAAVAARSDHLHLIMRYRLARYQRDQLALARRYTIEGREPETYGEHTQRRIERVARACTEPYDTVWTSGSTHHPKQLLYPRSRASRLRLTFLSQMLLTFDRAWRRSTRNTPPSAARACLARRGHRRGLCPVVGGGHGVRRPIRRQQSATVQVAPTVPDDVGNDRPVVRLVHPIRGERLEVFCHFAQEGIRIPPESRRHRLDLALDIDHVDEQQ